MTEQNQDEDHLWRYFERLHVVRRLRQLVGERWRIQLNFTDASGAIRGVPPGRFFSPLHQCCVYFTGAGQRFAACRSTAQAVTEEMAHTDTPRRVSTCHAGFSTLSVAIRHSGEYLGCVFADGFVLVPTAAAQRHRIGESLSQAGASPRHQVPQWVDAVPALDEVELEFLATLIEVVTQEIVAVHAELASTRRAITHLSSQGSSDAPRSTLIGESPEIENLRTRLSTFAATDSLILIQGENGTGKEVVARLIHQQSPRAREPFLAINCAALSASLLESELFGHRKGAFTGADRHKPGLFEVAGRGTLLLDEIGELPLSLQAKLLRVLADGTFIPVGGLTEKQTQARLLCATNRDLAQLTTEGAFRDDLYYRLKVLELVIPPLRQRRQDIPLLTQHFLETDCRKHRRDLPRLSGHHLEQLCRHDWPGNVRELKHFIERVVLLGPREIDASLPPVSEHAPPPSQQPGGPSLSPLPISFSRLVAEGGKLSQTLEALERQILLEGLEQTRWNKSLLARTLGISRSNLLKKIAKYELD